MIRVTISYLKSRQHSAVEQFDLNYYIKSHMPMMASLCHEHGCCRWEVDAPSEQAGSAPFHAVGYLYFNDINEALAAIKSTAAQAMEDVPNYTNVHPRIMFSQVHS
ncbi:EthD family reductase [Shewanella corallii]|uniref:EthD family reductase n=1 Tax=Shewanella corallii TaxID=560080 RepID=A0ABT0N4A9_9GAMM|nr:EthD family reductase [Shewanella corallii]MCL2913272.1 EthD family reductase [Shewanella corallii]